MYILFTEPKKFRSLIKETFKLCRATFLTTLSPFILSCILNGISYIYNLHIEKIQGKHYHIPFFSIFNFLHLIAGTYINIWFIHTVDNIAKHRQESLQQILIWSLKRYFYLLTALFIVGILFYLGYRAFVFPAIFIGYSFLFISYPIVVDNDNIFSAMKKSIQFAWNYWWQILSILIFICISFSILGMLFVILLMLLSHLIMGHFLSIPIIVFIGLSIPLTAFYLWFWNFLYLLYYDIKLLRIQKTIKAILPTT